MQVYKVVFSDLARCDLFDIKTYLLDVAGERVAQHVEKGILSEAKKLRIFPSGYPKDFYASSDNLTVRFIIKWRYKILFVIDEEKFEVQVVGIFHTAQNPDKMEKYGL